MATIVFYSLVQVVPDPVRGERLNVGVVVWNEQRREGASRFDIRGTQRLRAVGLQDARVVSEFSSWLKDAISLRSDRIFRPGDSSSQQWSLEFMERVSHDWAGVIQLTEPRASRGSVPEVLREVFERMVRLESAKPADAGRQAIRKDVAKTLRAAFSDQPGPPHRVEVSAEIRGSFDTHEFDIAVVNGAPRGLILTPYLRDPRSVQITRDLDAAVFATMDVREGGTAADIALLDDPDASKHVRNRVERLTDRFKITRLLRADLVDWAEDVVRN